MDKVETFWFCDQEWANKGGRAYWGTFLGEKGRGFFWGAKPRGRALERVTHTACSAPYRAFACSPNKSPQPEQEKTTSKALGSDRIFLLCTHTGTHTPTY